MSDHSEAFVAFDSSKLRNAERLELVAIADGGRAGEVRFLGAIENTGPATAKLVRKLSAKYERLTFCYEAGPTGYGLHRQIKSLGYECVVVAPSLIPKRPGDKVKTNRRDAISLAKLLRADELTAVWVPDRHHEAMRDLTRARETTVMDLRSKRQQISAFLLRQGRHYPENKKTWTKAHMSWLASQKLEYPEQRLVFEEMMLAIRQAQERRERLEQEIRVAVPDWSLAEVVTALMAMRGIDLIAAVGDDRVNVLQHLEPLEPVVVVNAHAGADDLEHVHDPERIVALVRTELAVVGMVDRDQRVDPGALGRVELVLLQLAPVGRQGAEIVAHHADRGLLEVDELHARHRPQDILGGLDHALDAGMAVEREAHRNARFQERPQAVEVLAQEQHERSHLERLRPARLLDRRQGGLGELGVAARAPRHHLAGLAARELVHGALGHAARGRDVAGAHLHDPAAMARPAQHLVGDAERVHDVERGERDVRGLEHVAAGVEHEIRRLPSLTLPRLRGAREGGAGRRLAEPGQQLVLELHLRDMGDLARDLAVALDALPALLGRLVLVSRHRDPRHPEQEARIDAVIAGLDAFAGQHAGARPFARRFRPVAGFQNVDDAGNDRDRLGVDAAGPGHRADLDAFAAARAGVGHRGDALGQRSFERDGHAGSIGRRQIG